jgi:hypothetical protein
VGSENVIRITVREKEAIADRSVYVCGNSCFVVKFDFDQEWDKFETKTARFICDNNSYTDVVFQGTTCPVPVLSNTHRIRIGVFAGNLVTTTPAHVVATKSILCEGGTPAAPTDNVYGQIMEMLNQMTGGGASLPPVSDADDGKVLMIVGGKWVVTDLPAGNPPDDGGDDIIPDEDIATDEDVDDMFDGVFGDGDVPEGDDTIPDGDIATDEEVNDMFNGIFGGG